jgi:hypothetical protein
MGSPAVPSSLCPPLPSMELPLVFKWLCGNKNSGPWTPELSHYRSCLHSLTT